MQPPTVRRHVRDRFVSVQDRSEVARHVRIRVETEHGVSLGQLGGELRAIPLGQAAHRDDFLGATGVLELGSLQKGVDGVLLGLLDEAAGVDHGNVGLGGVIDQQPALGSQATGELLGVDFVASAS